MIEYVATEVNVYDKCLGCVVGLDFEITLMRFCILEAKDVVEGNYEAVVRHASAFLLNFLNKGILPYVVLDGD